MAFTDRKLETGILVLSVVLLGGLGYVLKTPVQSVILGQDIVYEMPRIKKSFLASLFDLGDREVDRSYTNPFAKKKAEEKKKEEAKKAEVAKAKAAAAKAVAKKAAETKKPKVEINTVQAAPAKTWGDDGFFGNSGGPSAGSQTGTKTNGTAANDTDADKSGRTSDQWKALLRAEPTPENVAKLVTAFSKQEFDSETFYSIVADLYRSNKAETQQLGLVAVKAFYNANSFIVTNQFMDQFTNEMEKEAEAYLKSYTSGRLGALAAVLKGSDTEAIERAARIVLDGYKDAKSGVVSGNDPRNTRGNVTLSNSVSDYSQFYAIFQVLKGHQDTVIAGLASSAEIPNPNAVASL